MILAMRSASDVWEGEQVGGGIATPSPPRKGAGLKPRFGVVTSVNPALKKSPKAKLNRRGSGGLPVPEGRHDSSRGTVSQEAERLIDQWILTFLEAPPLVDVELMRMVLAEHETRADENPP